MEKGLSISSLEGWARYHWRLKGNLSLFHLEKPWILFEFELAKEVERVLQEGLSVFKQRPLKLERWSPTLGCLSERAQINSYWVRIVGLPLCLWHKDFFKRVDDACGGYVGVDEETVRGKNLQWARVLIKTNGKKGTKEVTGCGGRTLFFSEPMVGDTSLGSSGGSPY